MSTSGSTNCMHLRWDYQSIWLNKGRQGSVWDNALIKYNIELLFLKQQESYTNNIQSPFSKNNIVVDILCYILPLNACHFNFNALKPLLSVRHAITITG